MNNRQPIRIGNIYRDCNNTGGNFAGNVFDIKGIAPALRTMQGGGNQPIVVIKVDKNN